MQHYCKSAFLTHCQTRKFVYIKTSNKPFILFSLEYCQQPDVPDNGRIIPTGQVASGSSVIFECDSGFRIEGTREVTCTSRLEWSNPSPICVGKI